MRVEKNSAHQGYEATRRRDGRSFIAKANKIAVYTASILNARTFKGFLWTTMGDLLGHCFDGIPHISGVLSVFKRYLDMCFKGSMSFVACSTEL